MASIVSAGTTSATALNMSADTSGVLQLASNNGTVAVTVSTAQLVGINQTSPADLLHMTNGTLRISGTTAKAIYLYGAATVKPYIDLNEYGVVDFIIGAGSTTSGTLSINASLGASSGLHIKSTNGYVGVNTSSPTSGNLEVQASGTGAGLWVQTGGTTSGYTIADFRTGSNASALQIFGNSNSTFGSGIGVTISANGSNSNGVTIRGPSSTSDTTTSSILYIPNYSTATGLPSFVQNWASPSNFGIGTHTGTNDNIVRIGQCSGSGTSFTWNGTYCNIYAGAYTNASDYRIKENVREIEKTGMLAKIRQLRGVIYNIIPNTDKDGITSVVKDEMGYIAHETQEILPLLVVGEKDAVDGAGNDLHQGIDYSRMVVPLATALAELADSFDAYVASHP